MINQKFFVVFLTICKIFAIVPISNRYIKYYKMYSSVIVVLVILNFYVYTIQILYNKAFAVQDLVYKVADYLAYFFESSTIVVLIVMNIFYRSNTLSNMFQKLTNVENFTGARKYVDFWIIFICLHVLVIFVIIYHPILCLRYFVKDLCTPYIGRVILWYYKTLVVILLYVTAKEIKLKFACVNGLLMKTGSKLTGNFGENLQHGTNLSSEKEAVLEDLGHIKKLYDELCDIVDDYNEVFGVTLLSFTLVTISNILLWTIVAIYSEITENKLISIIWLSKTLVSLDLSSKIVYIYLNF